MSVGFFNVPAPKNEPVKSYAPNSPERAAIQTALAEARSKALDLPMYIGDSQVFTANKHKVVCPHDHQHSSDINRRAIWPSK